ncbi:hypothetical protein CWI36_0753p0010 [Hamiltosporidium magnivora]|uniref:Uncharacterized protein n=1 Tax=Hamiltosporidium magnivora TaxID=148818 RepID=A0A4Q9L9T9_9MICR|nr:hypothetical protein CWI36_0753p0010 [Hamiltosporidium magnivora]
MNEEFDLKSIKVLNIIYGSFTMKNEPKFLETLEFKSLNYITTDCGYMSLNNYKDFISFVGDISSLSAYEIIFDENRTIGNFYFGASLINNQILFYKFFNKMKASKIFKFFCRSTSECILFQLESAKIRMNLLDFDNLVFLLFPPCYDIMTLCLSLRNFMKICSSSDFLSRTLFKAFDYDNFCGLDALRVVKANIGAADKMLMKNLHIFSL